MRTARYREAKGDKPMNNISTHAHPGKRAEGAVNRCHCCGATAYKTLIARDAAGAMRPSGRYQCVQCLVEFAQVSQWREGMVPVPV